MGGPGSGRRKRVDGVRCVDHPVSSVTSAGSYTAAGGGKRLKFRCEPVRGSVHWFSIHVVDRTTTDDEPTPPPTLVALWSPKPPCPTHPGSHVVRDGRYGTATPNPRQRYRCYPDPTNRAEFHSFTPYLPREHVCAGEDHCAHCEELRGVHRGETAAARRHTWPTRLVVEGLARLAAGESYAEIGRWALRRSGKTRTRAAPAPPADGPAQTDETSSDTGGPARKKRKASAATKEARNAWHIGADWVEAFGPVVWTPVDDRLRRSALDERSRLDSLVASGEPVDFPQVVLVDDVPVYGREFGTGKARRDAGFYVLAAAEVHWDRPDDPMTRPGAATRLRLLRALPKANGSAWRLLFDELGYTPDYVVADAGRGITAAFAAHFAGTGTKFVPSMWHLAAKIETGFDGVAAAWQATPAGKRLIEPLRKHLAGLHRAGALADAATWRQWWDSLDELVVANRLPVEKTRRHRRAYEPAVAGVLDDIAAYPDMPVSTGGLETLITKHVHPILAMRRTAFGNIERTNCLLDLVVTRHHGAFDDHLELVKLLRVDAGEHGGWTTPMRAIEDPHPPTGRYSSLRDATLLHSLAAERGLL